MDNSGHPARPDTWRTPAASQATGSDSLKFSTDACRSGTNAFV